ncbi:MAG: NUDIX domain-containing protein [Deltaproteobacteria bacterium]|nr:NUDIX domain-containing protein [Deltaproteobacteria bacterium]
MNRVIENPRFLEMYRRLATVTLNPRRHTAPNVLDHSELAARIAVRLGELNSCTWEELNLLEDLGRAHDVGKATGTSRPERSVEVLRDCGVEDATFLSLVKWHDTALPWYRAAQRGEPPSEKAWRRLAREVDLRLLCVFTVADRADAPGGWRRNAPTPWFVKAAHERSLVGSLHLDVPEHPSETSAGGVLVREGERGRELLLIRVRADGFELPKGGIEFDESAEEAASREVHEETGVLSRLQVRRHLGDVSYLVDHACGRFLKRVRYFVLVPEGELRVGNSPNRTLERVWLRSESVESIPLVNEDLRPLLRAALVEDGHAT